MNGGNISHELAFELAYGQNSRFTLIQIILSCILEKINFICVFCKYKGHFGTLLLTMVKDSYQRIPAKQRFMAPFHGRIIWKIFSSLQAVSTFISYWG